MTRRRVQRWNVGLVGTLALTGFGLLYASRTLLVAAAIPLTYVLYGVVSGLPASAEVAVRRSFDQPDPRPGEAVTVTVTIENTGDSVLSDLRVIDGVPDELAVTDGSPRAALSVPPGGTATLEYTVVAKRGQYDFGEPAVRLRSLAATETETLTVDADGDVTLSCANTVEHAPIRDAALPRAGTLPTDTGGSGLEFYATRQYQAGDPMNRVDWRHYAKTGEFVTVQYRQEQSIRTVLLVDARPVGRITPRAGYPTGAELCAYAGERLYDTLSDAGIATTVTAVGVDDGALDGLVGPDGLPWVDPEERGHAARAKRVLSELQDIADQNAAPHTLGDVGGRERAAPTTRERRRRPEATAETETASGGTDGQSADREVATTPRADGGPDERIQRVLARLPPNAQVVVCSPVVDGWPADLVRSLAVRGYPQVLVSPDVTGGDSVGQTILGVRRRLHLRDAELAGATTVSWDLDQPIDYALRESLPHLLGGR